MLSIAGAVFFWYTMPAYDDVGSVKQEIARYDQALERARELQELKRALVTRYNTFSSDQINRLQKLLPDHIDNVRLVLDLDSLALRHNMPIQGVTVSEKEQGRSETVLSALSEESTPVDSRVLEFSTTGTYEDFVRFMSDLESSLRIVDLAGLTLNRSTSEGVDLYQFTVAVKTYWLK
jgi:Tfp pilus assembly protein PilO